MATISLEEPVYRGKSSPVFFAAGFRPFFLFAGIQAALVLPLWLAVYMGGLSLELPFSPVLWHGHEMVFGFAAAAVGGFLLTAVPNWTGTKGVSGKPLIILFVMWLAGRFAFTMSGILPSWLVAVVDMAYLPFLAVLMAKPLIGAGKARNMAFLPILALFTVTNGLVHADVIANSGTGQTGVSLGIGLLLMMIAIVGGRIIPSFTQNWLRMQGRGVEPRLYIWIEKGGAVGSIFVASVAMALAPDTVATGVLAGFAAIIHMIRLAGWHGQQTWRNPILVILHVGYLWMVLGLGLTALSAFIPALPSGAALHALTAGAIGTMILAVMTRAALGHSGRPLQVSRFTVAAYILLSLGTALRVFAPLLPEMQLDMTHAGGSLWAMAWIFFVGVYLPVVTRPRADGRPG